MAKPTKLTSDQILAKIFVYEDPTTGYCLKRDLIYVSSLDLFAIYKDGFYSLMDHKKLEQFMYDALLFHKKEGIFPFNTDASAHLCEALRRQLALLIRNEAGDFLSSDLTYYALSDQKTLCLQTQVISDWSRAHKTFLHVPISAHQLTEQAPKFKEFLSQILVQEDDITQTDLPLVKWFELFLGSLILPSLSSQAAFFFVGERAANGKSTLIDVISKLLPAKFQSFLSLQELSTSAFALSSLRGKLLNISEEEESKYVQSNIFKKLVSGEMVSADVKFKDRVQFRARAKFVFLTNSYPTMKDYDPAVRRRTFIIPFHKSFQNSPARKERSELVQELLSELPGIFSLALQGAQRLMDLKYQLPRTPSMDKAQKVFETNLKSSYEFFEENYEVDTQSMDTNPNTNPNPIECDTLYDQYTKWCDHVGAQKQKRQNFLADITKRYEPDGLYKCRLTKGKYRPYCYTNLTLKVGLGGWVEQYYFPDPNS